MNILIGELGKQRKNYYSSISNYLSLLLWPILKFFQTLFVYKSFDIEPLKKYFIFTNDDLTVFILIGALGYNFFHAMVESAIELKEERENGTLEIIFLSPANRLLIIYGRAIGGIFQSCWMFSIFIIFIVISKSNTLIQALYNLPLMFISLFIASLVWGGFMNSVLLLSRDSRFLYTICEQPLKFFSGTDMPTAAFPFWAKIISSFSPLTYCLIFIRSVFFNGQFLIKTYFKFSFILIFLFIITYILLKYGEYRNRDTGGLQFY